MRVIKCNSIRTFSVSYVDVNCLECYHHTLLAKRFLHELPWAKNKFLKPPLLDSKTILFQAESTFSLALRVELATFWFAVKEEGRQANIDERLALKADGFCTVGVQVSPDQPIYKNWAIQYSSQYQSHNN